MPIKERQPQNQSAAETLRTRVDQGLRLLLQEMQRGKSDRLTKYLEFSARFRRYSVYNQMLIYWQRPNATFVAGYRKWQELGYQVAKGERGIRILAPCFLEKKEPEIDKNKPIKYFVPVTVFDASQLAAQSDKPLPFFFLPLPDDQQVLYARLVRVVEADHIQVEEAPLGLMQGFSMGRRVAVREDADSTSKFLTLLHEYTHELLHRTSEGRQQGAKVKECHAEAVAYVVAHHFGIHNPFSSDYLQHWGNTPKDLLSELDIVRRTAAQVIERLEEPDSPQPLMSGEKTENPENSFDS